MKRVLIAGGGIGGLATAVALQQRGIGTLVCEQAPELREVGAGLLLSPNAVHVLEQLGLGAAATACSRPITEWRILDATGRMLHMMPAQHAGAPALSLHRADLQSLLQRHLSPATLRLGFTVAGHAQTDGYVELIAQSGERVRGAALIGADGLRSAVRRGTLGDEPPRFCGYVGWRSVVAGVPRGYEGGWLSESWGEGKRFGISPLGGNRCYWYATANRAAHDAAAPAQRRAELLALFGHWHAPIPALIASTPEDAILLNDIFDRPARGAWTQKRVTLLGDAAHPMSPNLGQGACTALEDAWVAARELSVSSSPADWPAALRRYERARRSRTTWINAASRILGAVIQLESPLTTRMRDGILRCTPGLFSRLAMRPLFQFRP